MIEMDMPKIEVEENESKSYAKIVVEPLEKGFGLTIGNCLRRILLSALPGAAVQGIRFYPDGLVKHEFSALPGIKEDVLSYFAENKIELKQEISVIADYYKTTGQEFAVRCQIREKERSLLDLTITVKSREQAEAICANWQKQDEEVYGYLMDLLLQ